jgi:hypothetical protein
MIKYLDLLDEITSDVWRLHFIHRVCWHRLSVDVCGMSMELAAMLYIDIMHEFRSGGRPSESAIFNSAKCQLM